MVKMEYRKKNCKLNCIKKDKNDFISFQQVHFTVSNKMIMSKPYRLIMFYLDLDFDKQLEKPQNDL